MGSLSDGLVGMIASSTTILGGVLTFFDYIGTLLGGAPTSAVVTNVTMAAFDHIFSYHDVWLESCRCHKFDNYRF